MSSPTEQLFAAPYALARDDKRRVLLSILNELDAHHEARCTHYAKLRASGAIGITGTASSLEDLPFMPVRLFKQLELKSVPDDQVFKVLHSSGTSTQTPSRIVLDRSTATLQTRALVAIMKPLLGAGRLPMLIIDAPTTVQAGARLSARAAGIVGFSMLGSDHTYALDASLEVDWERVHAFLARHQGKPLFVFGFTFLIWQYFYRAAQAAGCRLDLGNATLLHGGGWKKLEAERVSPSEFSACLSEQFGISKVRSYYGMVEQVGSIFVECEAGRLHTPAFADVIVRDAASFAPQPIGARGVVQVLSALPHSYPGHSLLTEDVGTWLGEDDCVCGKKGKSFSVEGRLAGVEARGCSDTFVRSPAP